MYSVTKDFTFSASHQLNGLREGHQCARLHGHNYTVRIEVCSAQLNGVGFVIDYGDLAPFGEWIDSNLDHRHLNDVVDGNPTAENLARRLADVLAAVVDLPKGASSSVFVSETPKTWAWWRP